MGAASSIHINDLLSIDPFQTFTILTNSQTRNCVVHNIGFLEYESIERNYDRFIIGDFILTTLFFAKDNSSLMETALKNLIMRHVSGIAIKTIYYKSIPSHIIKLANENHVCILLFDDIYIEDIISVAKDQLKNAEKLNLAEATINQILNNRNDTAHILASANALCSHFHKYICSYYLLPSEQNFNLKSFWNTYQPTYSSDDCFLSIYPFRNGLLFLQSSSDKLFPSDQRYQKFTHFLDSLGLSQEQFYTGINFENMPLENVKTSIKTSIYYAHVAHYLSLKKLDNTEVGIYNMLLPILDSPYHLSSLEHAMATIKEYDSNHNSDLYDTLILYIENNGNISTTAKQLFQHPNTIRYRVTKMKELLNIVGPNEDCFYEYLYMLVHAYRLKEFIPWLS